MINRRIISAAVALVSSAVGMVLSAAHTKKDLIEIRRERWEELRNLSTSREKKMEEGLAEYRDTPDAVLLDVRERADYDQGHIPGAVHAELQSVRFIPYSLDTPLFVYCYRGNRSAMAAEMLREAGFKQIRDIGGIEWYHGDLE